MIKQSSGNTNSEAFSPIKSITAVLKANVKAYLMLVVCFALMAVAYTYTDLPAEWLSPSINILAAISLLLAGFDASFSVKTLGYLHGALAGLVHWGVRILTGLAIFKSYVATDNLWLTLILSALISAAGGIAGVNFGKNKRKKKR